MATLELASLFKCLWHLTRSIFLSDCPENYCILFEWTQSGWSPLACSKIPFESLFRTVHVYCLVCIHCTFFILMQFNSFPFVQSNMLLKWIVSIKFQFLKQYCLILVRLLFNYLFRTWCSAADRQRINANGFLTPYDLFSWKKEQQSDWNLNAYVTKINLVGRLVTLFAPILLHHVRLGWSFSSSPMLSLPLLETDCLSFHLSGGPGSPLPPLTHADPISFRPH
jgi:hypothetical protein